MIEGPKDDSGERGEPDQQPDDQQQQKQNKSPIDAMSDTRGATAALILGQLFLYVCFSRVRLLWNSRGGVWSVFVVCQR